MPRWQIAYLAACMSVAGGSLAYALCDFGGWPKVMFEPYTSEWLVASTPPSSSAMVYPGMILWALCGGLCSAAVTLLVAGRSKHPASDAVLNLAAAYALTATLFTGLYFLWGLWPF